MSEHGSFAYFIPGADWRPVDGRYVTGDELTALSQFAPRLTENRVIKRRMVRKRVGVARVPVTADGLDHDAIEVARVWRTEYGVQRSKWAPTEGAEEQHMEAGAA